MSTTKPKNAEYRRRYVERHPERHRAQQRARRHRMYAVIRTAKSRPCQDCGVQYPPWVMDFDHRDPTQKLFGVGAGFKRSLVAVLAEIAKCDVVCANCHRLRHPPPVAVS